MKRYTTVLLFAFVFSGDAAVKMASDGKALVGIMVGERPTAPTRFASEQFAETLERIVGEKPQILSVPQGQSEPSIFVGPSASAQRAFPEIDFANLASEEIVIKTKSGQLLLTGGGDRGTLYAVSRFLQEQCGVRWWTPWASRIPKNPNLSIANLDIRYRPPFALREPFWMPAFDALWAVRNTCNGESARIPDDMGGCIRYKGFVHTFYALVRPEKHFQEHPEWFSLIKGKRVHDRAQLCLTNPKLRDFMVQRVREWLTEGPETRIISVSQNDWGGACECDPCKSLDEREGSHSGTMLDFVNHVAQRIERDFPSVFVDTLAYQYTRKPPKTLRPRQNVIVRVCANDCNFRESFGKLSNSSFAGDFKGWSAVTERLYVWDYTANFANLQPHPNWFILGPNIRWFASHKVQGVFEQGFYQSHGSEMAEMRAWVLAQLLWNPQQDDRALIREFLAGYFGPAAAVHIYSYLELMHNASKGYLLTSFCPSDAPFLQYQHLATAEELWARAEKAVENDSDLRARVRLARLPLRYVWLKRWELLRKTAADSTVPWPLPEAREAVVDEWKTVVQGEPEQYWTKVNALNEAGLTSDQFLANKNVKN